MVVRVARTSRRVVLPAPDGPCASQYQVNKLRSQGILKIQEGILKIQ